MPRNPNERSGPQMETGSASDDQKLIDSVLRQLDRSASDTIGGTP